MDPLCEIITCPICGDTVYEMRDAAEGESTECFLCNTLHHTDCWQFNGGCGMFGCKEEAIRQSRCTLCGTIETQALNLGLDSHTLGNLDAYQAPRREPKGSSFCADCTRDLLEETSFGEELFYTISALFACAWLVLMVGYHHLLATVVLAQAAAVLLPVLGIGFFVGGVKKHRTTVFPEIPPVKQRLIEDRRTQSEKNRIHPKRPERQESDTTESKR